MLRRFFSFGLVATALAAIVVLPSLTMAQNPPVIMFCVFDDGRTPYVIPIGRGRGDAIRECIGTGGRIDVDLPFK